MQLRSYMIYAMNMPSLVASLIGDAPPPLLATNALFFFFEKLRDYSYNTDQFK